MKQDSKFFGTLQTIGRSLILPICILPIAGLLLGIGASCSNMQMINSMGLNSIMGQGTVLFNIFSVMSKVGDIVFKNLPVIFAVGVSIGLAKNERSVAALSSLISFLVMHQTISALLTATGKISLLNGMLQTSLPSGTISDVCGITSLNMGVFGGIIVGIGVALLHNKFYKIKLPDVLAYFGGTKFIPIISSLTYVLVGSLMFFIWPPIQELMLKFSNLINGAGYIGTFIYGLIERSLIPFGLHPVFYMPFWQTALGGTMNIDGQSVSGALNIFFAQLASPNTTHFNVEATKFMTGKFPVMIFGLPAASLAMYRLAKDSKKKVVGGLLLSAAFTSLLTGITEPIEFTFLFVAPVLYAVHCVLAGLSFMLMHMLQIAIGQTFSGGLIDLILFGVIQGNDKTNWIRIIPVGAIYFAVYYFVFYAMIKKMNLMTPGREEDSVETKLYTKKDFIATKSNLSQTIVDGLGGVSNIDDIGCCATRLRLSVKDSAKVDKNVLNTTNPSGIIINGSGVQIIYGPRVTVIKSELEEYVKSLDRQ